MTGSLGRRYARALEGLARDAAALATLGDELERATATFETPALRAVVVNPGLPPSSRRAIVDKVLERLDVSATVGNFVRVIADHDRLGALRDVARAYQTRVDRRLGRARVTVRSAAALSEQQLAEVTALAGRLTGGREVLLSTAIDPELIGGVVLETGGTVYDGSVKTQLARLATRMAGDGA